MRLTNGAIPYFVKNRPANPPIVKIIVLGALKKAIDSNSYLGAIPYFVKNRPANPPIVKIIELLLP
jgi:hypothetical protein